MPRAPGHTNRRHSLAGHHPLLSIHERGRQEGRRLRVRELLGPSDSPRRVGAGPRTPVLAVEDGALAGGHAPVVPAGGGDDVGQEGAREDDARVSPPRAPQVHLHPVRPDHPAVDERVARVLGARAALLRREGARGAAGALDDVERAALVERQRVAEDEVDGALDEAVLVVVPPGVVVERVLGAQEAAPEEGGLVARDLERHGLRAGAGQGRRVLYVVTAVGQEGREVVDRQTGLSGNRFVNEFIHSLVDGSLRTSSK